MPTKPEPLPVPSTDHDLTNIKSPDWLAVYDTYVCAILEGIHAFHGSASEGSGKAVAKRAALIADAAMAERQDRAQGHIDQQTVERAKEKAKKARE